MLIHWLFYIFCITQILFFILVLSAFLKIKTVAPSKTQHKTPGTSVVICAHNEVRNLKKLLPLLYQQDYSQKEIIVVDDHSTDNTKEFLNHERIFYPELRVVHVNSSDYKSGKKKALQQGIQLAQHEIILLTDADCLPNSNQWMKEICSQFGNDKVQIVLGYSPYFKKPGLLNAFIQYETLYTAILYISAALLGFPYMGVGRNLAYRKALFIHNNNFSQHASILGGDDDLFINLHANRQNTRVALGEQAHVKSIPQTSWKKFLDQKHRHLEAGKYYKLSDKIWLGTVVLSHLFFWICFCLLLVYNYNSPYIILSGFLIRTICLIIVYKYVSHRLNDQINIGLLVFLDFLFVIYYVTTGIRAFFFKKKRWK